ncbi:hypothetical protein GCM10027169_27000 [Gordonia jinhuaensis]|uniref:Uncharacterized protein n=1 Tax=Gordonia jinhuaensis TaxID=1517702 RepID=A0A916TB31_9ACTN|nr:hypothetical protein GCM10011489_26870 [Gordonia jinhuaensis]
MPQRDHTAGVEHTEDQCAHRQRRLGADEECALVEPIGQTTGRDRQHRGGPELQGHHDAHGQTVGTREMQNQPVLGDALHPGADQRHDLATGPIAIIAHAE